jgi:hypothetical protein
VAALATRTWMSWMSRMTEVRGIPAPWFSQLNQSGTSTQGVQAPVRASVVQGPAHPDQATVLLLRTVDGEHDEVLAAVTAEIGGSGSAALVLEHEQEEPARPSDT